MEFTKPRRQRQQERLRTKDLISRTIAIAVHWVINLDTFFRQLQIALALQARAGGVGHDSQSVPGEIFARAHFHLIAEGQTSPRAERDVEITEEVRSLSMVKEFSNGTSLLNISQADLQL